MFSSNEQINDMILEAIDNGAFKHEYTLRPKNWETNRTIALNWNVFKWYKKLHNKLPDKPGIYAYLLKPDNGCKLDLMFPLYFGITSKRRGIKKRFSDYLTEMKSPYGRPRILFMMNVYKKNLFYAYVSLENNTLKELEDIEDKLIAAFDTQYNTDLKAETKKKTGLIFR